MAGLDRCGKSRPQRDSIPGQVQPVASRYTGYATRPTSPQYPFHKNTQSKFFYKIILVTQKDARVEDHLNKQI